MKIKKEKHLFFRNFFKNFTSGFYYLVLLIKQIIILIFLFLCLFFLPNLLLNIVSIIILFMFFKFFIKVLTKINFLNLNKELFKYNIIYTYLKINNYLIIFKIFIKIFFKSLSTNIILSFFFIENPRKLKLKLKIKKINLLNNLIIFKGNKKLIFNIFINLGRIFEGKKLKEILNMYDVLRQQEIIVETIYFLSKNKLIKKFSNFLNNVGCFCFSKKIIIKKLKNFFRIYNILEYLYYQQNEIQYTESLEKILIRKQYTSFGIFEFWCFKTNQKINKVIINNYLNNFFKIKELYDFSYLQICSLINFKMNNILIINFNIYINIFELELIGVSNHKNIRNYLIKINDFIDFVDYKYNVLYSSMFLYFAEINKI